jgi:hypothetical protein
VARVKNAEPEIIFEETPDEFSQEYKTETFLKSFEASNEFTLTLYKHQQNGKREIVTKYINTIPDLIDDIQAVYGGGTYEFYAYETVDGKKRFNSQKFNIAEPVNKTRSIDPDAAEDKAIKRMLMYKEMFGNGNNTDNSSVMLKLMEMQNAMNNKLMEMQRQSQKELTELILSVKSDKTEKTGFKDLIEAYEIIQDLKGENPEKDTSFIEKMLPAMIPLLTGAGQLNINKPAVIENPVQHNVPVIKEILNVDEIDSIIDNFSDEIKSKVTAENKMIFVEKFYSLNSDKLSRSAVMQIIDRVILRNSGAA